MAKAGKHSTHALPNTCPCPAEFLMAQIHIQQSKSPVLWAVLLGALGLGGAIFWQMNATSDTTTATPPETNIASAAMANPMSAPAEPAKDVAALLAQQAEATRQIEKEPAIQPAEGSINERPSYLSVIEWEMLKGVAQQSDNPTQALTRLVNSVRYTKQLEVWQDMPKGAPPEKRQALAKQLLQELPDRLTQGDYDFDGAKLLHDQLLNDAEPNATKRQALSERLLQRMRIINDEQIAKAAAAAPPKASGIAY
jgi:cytoskeletal protein RodZ